MMRVPHANHMSNYPPSSHMDQQHGHESMCNLDTPYSLVHGSPPTGQYASHWNSPSMGPGSYHHAYPNDYVPRDHLFRDFYRELRAEHFANFTSGYSTAPNVPGLSGHNLDYPMPKYVDFPSEEPRSNGYGFNPIEFCPPCSPIYGSERNITTSMHFGSSRNENPSVSDDMKNMATEMLECQIKRCLHRLSLPDFLEKKELLMNRNLAKSDVPGQPRDSRRYQREAENVTSDQESNEGTASTYAENNTSSPDSSNRTQGSPVPVTVNHITKTVPYPSSLNNITSGKGLGVETISDLVESVFKQLSGSNGENVMEERFFEVLRRYITEYIDEIVTTGKNPGIEGINEILGLNASERQPANMTTEQRVNQQLANMTTEQRVSHLSNLVRERPLGKNNMNKDRQFEWHDHAFNNPRPVVLPVSVRPRDIPSVMESADKMKQVIRVKNFCKTAMCRYHREGKCNKPASICQFAHCLKELRIRPILDKTSWCKEFVSTGHCAEGKACKFAHTSHELRTTANLKRTKPCRFYFGGKGCMNGEHCRFSHGEY